MNMTIDDIMAQEPDEFTFVYRGYLCAVVRHGELKHFCGYVAIPLQHPAYGKDDESLDIDVHGGITYSSGRLKLKSQPTAEKLDMWWIGFDCAHWMDLSPGLAHLRDIREGEVYRTFGFVCSQIADMVTQLEKMNDGK